MVSIAAIVIATAVLSCGDLCSAEAVSTYARLNALAASHRYAAEQAAFLVRGPDGRLRTVVWLRGEESRATYSGRIPRGCVAIVHTHPLAAPEPSRQDRAEAQRIKLPIVVITPAAISVADPDGSERNIFSEGWQKLAR